ncbi:MAG TPA: hypothetical protein GX727_00320, partial [Clostridium sp.]|nr:hypothetical protein [Clostridium sp.]
FKVTLGTKLPGKTVVVKITDVEDTALHPNKLSEYKATIEITDKTAPEVTKVSFDTKVINKGKENEKTVVNNLYFFFSEDVTNTALDKNNYKIMAVSGALTSFENAPRFHDGSRVVKIELTDKEAERFTTDDDVLGGDDLFVEKIQDKAGNAMAGQIYKKEIKATDDDAPIVESIEATAKDKLVITFDQRLVGGNNIPKDIFEVSIGGDEAPAKNNSISVSVNDDGNTVVTLTINKNINADASNVILVIENDGEEKYLKNTFGVPAVGGTFPSEEVDIADKIAPSIEKIIAEDGKVTDVLDIKATVGSREITVEFDEGIKNTSLSSRTFSVNDYTVESVSSGEDDSSTVTITLTKEVKDVNTIRLTQNQPVEDVVGNEFKLDKQVTVDVEPVDGD